MKIRAFVICLFVTTIGGVSYASARASKRNHQPKPKVESVVAGGERMAFNEDGDVMVVTVKTGQ